MPVTIRRALDFAGQENKDLSSITKMHGVSADLIERVQQEMQVEVLTRMYGLTESAGLVSMIRVQDGNIAHQPSCVGYPLPGLDVRIVDPESGSRMETGETGEIVFDGWNRFPDYLDADRHTGGIDRDGFFHTGDRGYLDADNCLHFLGRFKEIIKTGGENVSRVEVERFIQEHIAGVKTVFVIGVPDSTWGEAVTAIIEMEQNVDLDPEVVHSVCNQGLASFKRPKNILWIPPGGWPQASTGKVDIRQLTEWACKALNISVP
jgi:fatty-acyl-CoA synthase